MGKEVFISERLSEFLARSAGTLKKYIDSFPDIQGFASRDDVAIKKATAEYYLCASALIKDLENICNLSDEVSVIIKKATESADEESLSSTLAIFDGIMDITRAYESFLQSSEKIVSGAKQDFSYVALHRAALALYGKLSLERSSS